MSQNDLYRPKKDHPWKRSYKANLTEEVEFEFAVKREVKLKPLALFLKEIVESWEDVEVNMDDIGYFGRQKLAQVGDKKQAEWFIDIIKRNYIKRGGNIDDDE